MQVQRLGYADGGRHEHHYEIRLVQIMGHLEQNADCLDGRDGMNCHKIGIKQRRETFIV